MVRSERLSPIPVQVPAGDTNVHNFAVTPATASGPIGGMVYLTTPLTNQGTVTINDGSGTPGGMVIGAGVGQTQPVIVLGPVANINSLGYRFSNVGDVLNVLIMN